MNIASVVPVESPENVEMGGKIASIKLVIAPLGKRIARYVAYGLTCFILWLLQYWIPALKIFLTHEDSDIDRAESVIVYGADGNIEIVPLVHEQTSKGTLKVFYYRLFKYYYDVQSRTFKPCQFHIEDMTLNQIHQTYGGGLDEAQVQDHAVFFGKNLTDIPKKSCLKLLIEEVLSPFYVFQIYSFIVWALDDYVVYAMLICLFSAVSIGLTLYETMQTTSKLRNMSYYEIPVTVYRKVNGVQTKMTINSSELVPGDVIEIPEGALMPCDAILLNGSTIMNESMLTGESIPVVKNSLPYNDIYYNPKEDKQYTLFAGTKCIQARYYSGNAVLGLVTLTGFTTVKGELIRTMLFPKPSDFKFYSDSFKFIFLLAIVAIAGFFIDLPSWLQADKEGVDMGSIIIIKASEIITVTVPPALPTCMQIGISVALSKLKKKQTYCISPNKINEAGRVNVMCFDKTGTLTEDGLDLLGVRPVFYDKNTSKLSFAKLVKDVTKLAPAISPETREKELQNYIAVSQSSTGKATIYQKTRMFPSEHMLEIMAACHGLTYVKNELIGDPLDIKMFEATKWIFEENDKNKYDEVVSAVVRPSDANSPSANETNPDLNINKKEIGIIRKFEFASKLQRMSVVVKNLSDSSFKMHIKGSPEKIRELCRANSIPENFHTVLSKYTEEGYRVLACATKTLNMNYQKIISAKREELEGNFTFIGFLIMENKLKPVTTEIIEMLHAANIKTVMVTGDNVLTAISVARQCGIVAPQQRIFLGELSEKKINGKYALLWRDFEFSDNTLNDELEPELDYSSRRASIIDSGRRNSQTRRSGAGLQIHVHHRKSLGPHDEHQPRRLSQAKAHLVSESIDEDEPDSPLLNEGDNLATEDQQIADMDVGVLDLEPPFFEMNEEDDYCIAVTGKAFSYILNEIEVNKSAKYSHILTKLLRKCAVFARMHPDEKALMIKHMMADRGNVVGMCGDGANDCGALKTANVGVSLSEAEASIAAPFTSKVQDISCIPRLLREGRAALGTSFQAFKYMALYSIIQFTTVTILYYFLIDLTNWHYYHIDCMIILPLSATMAMSGTYGKLTKYKPTGRLISVAILTSVIGQGIIQIGFQIFMYYLLTQQDFYDPNSCQDNFDTDDACDQNTTMYLFSIHQYTIIALAFMVGRPFRKPFYTNAWFTIGFVLLMCANIITTLNPFNFEFMYDWNGETRLPNYWRNQILLFAAINGAITLFWERVIVKTVSIGWKNHRDKKERYLRLQESKYKPPTTIPEANESQEQGSIAEIQDIKE